MNRGGSLKNWIIVGGGNSVSQQIPPQVGVYTNAIVSWPKLKRLCGRPSL